MTDPAQHTPPPREPSIEELFAQYLEQPVDTRASWLEQACHGDHARMALIRHLAGFARTPSTQPEAMSNDLSPDAIPGLRLRGTLGSGAMGDVLIAYEEEPGRLVAVKVLRRLGTVDGLLDRFRREITALATLDDPGIVRILRSGVLESADGVRPWFSMELVRDARPITAAARAQSWPHTRCIRAVRDAARALHGAHARSLIHGDLSPANILIDAEGRVRLIDFGIARWAAEAGSAAPMATLTVAAPEQMRGAGVDHRSDVHALGAVLAWIATGEPPRRAMDGSVLAPTEALADEPDLLAVIQRATNADPAQRHASAAEFADDLDALLEHRPLVWRRESARQWIRRLWRQDPRPVVFGLGLITALIVLVVGASWAAREFAARAANSERDRRTALLQLAEQNVEDGAVAQARTVIARRGTRDGSLEERMVLGRLARASDTILRHAGHVYRVALGSDGSVLANLGGKVVAIDARHDIRELLPQSPSGANDAESIDLAPLDHDRLGVMYSDGSWCVLDPTSCRVIATHPPDQAITVLRASATAGAFVALTPSELIVTNRDGAIVRTLPHGVAGSPRALAIDPRGTMVAVGGIQGDLARVPLDGSPPQRTTLPGSRIWGLAFSPDGQRIAVGSRDGTIRMVESRSLDVLHARRLHSTEITGLAWDPYGVHIATCGSDQRVHIVDALSLESLHDLPTTLGRPWSLAWDGDALVIAEQGGVERVAPDAPPLPRLGPSHPLEGGGGAWTSSWRWENGVVLRAPNGTVLREWNLRTQDWSSPWPPVVAVGLSADGDTLFAGGSGNRLLRLDPAHAEPVERIDTTAVATVFGAVAEVQPGGDLIIGGMDGHLMRCDRACTTTLWRTDTYAFEPESIIVDRQSERVIAAWRDGRLAVHRLGDGALMLDARLSPLRTNRIQRDAAGRLVVDTDRGRFILAGP